MKENEKNSHYIVTTKSGRREKVNADQVKQLEGMTRFYKGSNEVAIFNSDTVESIVKGKDIETR